VSKLTYILYSNKFLNLEFVYMPNSRIDLYPVANLYSSKYGI